MWILFLFLACGIGDLIDKGQYGYALAFLAIGTAVAISRDWSRDDDDF